MPTLASPSAAPASVSIKGAAAVNSAALFDSDTPAYAAPTRPRVHTTMKWGAQPLVKPLRLVHHRPMFVVIHHASTPNVTRTTTEHAYEFAREVQRRCIERGWRDSGNHFNVARSGIVTEARHGSLQAAIGGNTFIEGIDGGIGIENEGTYATELPPAAQRKALIQLVAWLCHQYQIPAEHIIAPDDFNGADRLYAELPALREEVVMILGELAPRRHTAVGVVRSRRMSTAA